MPLSWYFWMALEPNVLTADTRDPTRIADEIESFGLAVAREQLPAGDYGSVSTLTGKTWLIERKEANNYLSDLTSGHLYEQMLKLQDAADLVYFLPEGKLVPGRGGRTVRTERGKTEWNYKAVYHSWVELDCLGAHQLPFVPKEYTARAIAQVFWTLNNGPEFIVEKNRRPLTMQNKSSPARRFAEPILGKSTLDKLNNKYANLWMLFWDCMTHPHEVTQVNGVGPTTVEKIRKLLTWRI